VVVSSVALAATCAGRAMPVPVAQHAHHDNYLPTVRSRQISEKSLRKLEPDIRSDCAHDASTCSVTKGEPKIQKSRRRSRKVAEDQILHAPVADP
jgi:hypothetical protein